MYCEEFSYIYVTRIHLNCPVDYAIKNGDSENASAKTGMPILVFELRAEDSGSLIITASFQIEF